MSVNCKALFSTSTSEWLVFGLRVRMKPDRVQRWYSCSQSCFIAKYKGIFCQIKKFKCGNNSDILIDILIQNDISPDHAAVD